MLRHRFPGLKLDISFTAPGGVTVLFGRSGSGKSSIVHAVAGLLAPDSCRVAIGERVLADSDAGIFVQPEKRRIGLVFQDARLFPHLKVVANLRYGERRAPPEAAATSFEEVVDLLALSRLLDRRPHTLSGGERQRVAIGRALLSRPLLLAMDEPLASLDAERRAEILPYLLRLRRSLNLPIRWC
jgi:molybdate transport system ATP-binding protein